jgi:hypothetical protein
MVSVLDLQPRSIVARPDGLGAGMIGIRISVPAGASVRERRVVPLVLREAPRRTTARDVRVHDGTPVVDVEEAHCVADLVHHDRAADLVAAAGAAVIHQFDLTERRAHVRLAAVRRFVLASDVEDDPSLGALAGLLAVSSAATGSEPLLHAVTARPIERSTTFSTSGSTVRPF